MNSAGLDADDQPYPLPRSAREMHELILGPSGFGKSRYLDYRVRQDILDGYGVCIIDPHGDDPGSVFKSTLRWLRQEGLWQAGTKYSRRTVRVLDISSRDYLTSLNPFFAPPVESGDEPEPWIIGKSLFTVFERVWGSDFSGFPTIQTLLPAVFVLLMERGLTLVDAATILSNDETARALRQRLLDNARDQAAKRELLNAHEKRPREFDATVMASRARISEFTNIPRIRQMFTAGGTPLDLRRVMDEGEILLVNLAPDDYYAADDRVCHIVGTWLVREFYRLSRARRNRSPYYLYVDEAAKYLTPDIEKILIEARKRALHLTMVCHNLQQLRDAGDGIYSAVTQTVNLLAVFGGLREDAEKCVDFLFDLDTETPVQVTARPMPTGQKTVITLRHASQTTTDSLATTDSVQQARTVARSRQRGSSRGTVQGGSQATIEGHTMAPGGGILPGGTGVVSLNLGAHVGTSFAESLSEFDTEGIAVSDTLGRGFAATVGRSNGQTVGVSDAVIDEYDTYFSSIHSLETVRYRAAVLLKRLPRRHFFFSMNRQPAVRLFVPTIPAIEVARRDLVEYTNHIQAVDPAALPIAEARARAEHSIATLTDKLSYFPAPGDPRVGLDVSDPTPTPFDLLDASNVTPFPTRRSDPQAPDDDEE